MAISTNRERRRFLLRLGLFLPLIVGCEEALIIPGRTEVVSVLLNPPSFPMAVGEVMRPDVLPRNAEGRVIVGGPVIWASSDSSVASVDSLGLVRGEWEGEAQITAHIGSSVGFTDVTITPSPASEWREHSCFVSLTGTIWCWGRGGNGELGNGLRNSSPVPVRVQLDEPVACVSAGASHSCSVTSSGAGYCWGRGAEGQIGNGSTGTQVVPVKIEFGLSFRSLSAGGRHTCGINTSGETRCWGWAVPRAARQRRDGGCQHTHSPSREYPLRAALGGGSAHLRYRPRRPSLLLGRQSARAARRRDAHHSHRSDSRTDGTSFFLHFRRGQAHVRGGAGWSRVVLGRQPPGPEWKRLARF